MAKSISGSVGKGGKNDPKDVSIIRGLLSLHQHWLTPIVVKASGKYNQTVEDAIVTFQQTACALKTPDGRVDPKGFTLQRLNMAHIPKPKHPIFRAASLRVANYQLTQVDYDNAAKLLNCEPEAIQAVAEVETGGRSAWVGDKPKILFERHYFRDRTKRKYNVTHPDVSAHQDYKVYGTYKLQYSKLFRAATLNEEVALMSTSWSLFQIMGVHFKRIGFSSVSDFTKSMMISEINHLDAFVKFINTDKNLLNAIQKKNWVKFARHYNGAGYASSRYDAKVTASYNKLKSISVNKKPKPKASTP